MMNPGLSRKAFEQHLGSEFIVLVEGNRNVSLTLTEVELLTTRESSDVTIESYSLIFEGPTTPMLAQSSFQFVHPHLGDLVIFIVPLGPISGVMRYEAVFN